MSDRPARTESTVLLLLPTARDNAVAAGVLERHGIATLSCRDAAQLARALEDGAGAVLLGEEWLACGAHDALSAALAVQPRWSDLPVLVMARPGADSPRLTRAIAELGNVTVLERPVRLSALVTAIGSAMRARARQHELRDHLTNLAHARNELADVARAKDEFLATLGHELRNPLAPMRSALLVLSDPRTEAGQRDELRQLLTRQVDHMARLVDDLIDVSRLTRGTIDLHTTRLDLRDVIANSVDLSRPLVTARRHTLQVELPDEPVWAEADGMRLTQAVGNLLNNSAKYSRPGGRIRLSLSVEDGLATIEVSDEGVGIEPDVLPHVFDMFTQGRDKDHRAQDGLGIGLTLVKRLVELHGGVIEACSEGRERGACFTIRLPCLAGDRTPATPARSAEGAVQSDLHGRRLLVVDDNRDAAATLVMVLELLGATPRVAYSGREALDVLRTFRPEAVLLDIGMPGMDGYEVARAIRADPILAGVRLIALTGWSQVDDQRRTREAGFDVHLSKPVDMTQLQEALRAAPRPVPAGAETHAPPAGAVH